MYQELLDKFLDFIEKNMPIKLTPQIEDNSTYLPRLYTELNGAINWNWEDEEIERFIRAFGDPYPGAFTYINDEIIRILKVRLEPSNISYHPFVKGKIITILSDGSVKVLLKNNVLIVVNGHDDPRLYHSDLTASQLHWVSGKPPTTPFICTAKTRYRQTDAACIIESIENGQCNVHFQEPQWAVTPEQSVVFYDNDICLGGGIIDSRFNR